MRHETSVVMHTLQGVSRRLDDSMSYRDYYGGQDVPHDHQDPSIEFEQRSIELVESGQENVDAKSCGYY